MAVYSVFIINKAGNLVFNQDFGPLTSKCSGNDYLVLASTFHSIHAISAQISPIKSFSGIEFLEADTFKLHCFQTLTGIKFILITEHSQPHIEQILKRIYELYCDFVLKNPFHIPEMPIKSEAFSSKVLTYICAFSV